MKNEIIFLGTGTSTGVPIIGCECQVCTSTNQKNNRTRTSILLKTAKNNQIVIDTTPDLRTQLLRENINHLDAAIITHDHADHLHGIDDLRPFSFFPAQREFPVYCSSYHAQTITNRFDYIFKRNKIFNKNNPYIGGGLPLLNLQTINLESTQDQVSNEEFYFFLLPHGNTKTLGFMHGTLAYLIDCQEIPIEVLSFLKAQSIEILIIDCLQKKSHPSHLDQTKCFDYIKQIGPKNGILIHMNHDLDHEELTLDASKYFNFPVIPSYDGMRSYYSA